MASRHHEVPTHLNVEDKVLFGLTVRQFLYVLMGCSAAYTAWDQLSTAAFGTRVIAAGMCAAVALAFALLRPAGRALEEWVVAALLFATSPRRATWRPPEPGIADWRPIAATWQELTPSPVWADAEEA
jgi:hypothetical protein